MKKFNKRIGGVSTAMVLLLTLCMSLQMPLSVLSPSVLAEDAGTQAVRDSESEVYDEEIVAKTLDSAIVTPPIVGQLLNGIKITSDKDGVNVLSENVDKNANIFLQYAYEIPAGYTLSQDGYQFKLPDELIPIVSSVTLNSTEAGEIGTISIDSDNLATISFKSLVARDTDIKDVLTVEASFNQAAIEKAQAVAASSTRRAITLDSGTSAQNSGAIPIAFDLGAGQTKNLWLSFSARAGSVINNMTFTNAEICKSIASDGAVVPLPSSNVSRDEKNIYVKYDWEIKTTMPANGDTYSFNYPSQIKLPVASIGPFNVPIIVNGSESAHFTCIVTEIGKKVDLVLVDPTNSLNGQNLATGYIGFGVAFDKREIGPGTPVEIEFGINALKQSIQFKDEAAARNIAVTKKGVSEGTGADKCVVWSVEFKPSTNPNRRDLTNVVITDTIPVNQDLLSAGAVATNNSNCNFNDVISAASGFASTDVQSIAYAAPSGSTNGTLIITFNSSFKINKKDGEKYSFKIKTKPTGTAISDAISASETEVVLNNKIETKVTDSTYNDFTYSATSNDVKYPVKLISKKGEWTKADASVIKWTVTMNESELGLNTAKIIDTIPAGLRLISNLTPLSGEPTQANDATNFPISVTGESSITVTSDGSGNYNYSCTDKLATSTFTCKFSGATTTKKELVYYTRVVNEDWIIGTTKMPDFSNKVQFSDTNIATITINAELKAGNSGSGNGVGSGLIVKTGKGYDASNHQLSWEIQLNDTTHKLATISIEDKIGDNQKYVKGSMLIDNVAVSDTDLTFDDINKDGCKITIPAGKLSDLDVGKHHIIAMKTEIIDPNAFANNAENKDNCGNTATMTATITLADNTTTKVISPTTGSVTQPAKSTMIKKECTNYDYDTKTLYWKVTVNQNKMPIDNAVITDTIPKEQTFNNDAMVNPSVTMNVATTTKDPSNPQTVTFAFPNQMTQEHVVTFTTTITDEKWFDPATADNANSGNGKKTKKTYNTAVFNGKSGTVTHPSVSVTAEKEISIDAITKDSNLTSTGGSNKDKATWSVIINPNQIHMESVEISDDLKTFSELEFPVKVELLDNPTFDANGHVTGTGTVVDPSQYSTVGSTPSHLKFKMTNPIDKTYRLEFVSYAIGSSKVTNEVELKGSYSQTRNSTPIDFVVAGGSGGGIAGQVGSISLNKEWEGTPTSGSAATFTLKRTDLVEADKTQTTDANGNIKFIKLRSGDYELYEISCTDEAYVVDPTTPIQANFHLNKKEDKSITYENKLVRGSITIVKKDATDDSLLSGAEFTVTADSTNKLVVGPFTNLTTDSTGKVKVDNLPYGTYTITEITAPTGYELNSATYTFKIDKDGKLNISNSVVTNGELEIKNTRKKGSVEVLKQDGITSSPLVATFTIAKKSTPNTVIDSKNTAGSDGKCKFESLDWGEYVITETVAPTGYQLNSAPKYFEVKSDNLSTNTPLVFNDFKKGTVTVNKVDAEDNTVALSGAKFKISNKSGNTSFVPIEDTTNATGICDFNGMMLLPGIYEITEVEAPTGYHVAVDPTQEFEVLANNNTAVTLTFADFKKGSVSVTKVDAESNAVLNGATFELKKIGDNTFTPINDTTADGHICNFGNVQLSAGEYSVREIKAPDGYHISDVPTQKFEVKNNEHTQKTLTFGNYTLGDIEISKIDAYTSIALSDVEFKLYNKTTNILVDTKTTGIDGKCKFINLPHGDYYALETKAHIGYQLDSKTQYPFTIAKGSASKMQIVKNYKLGEIIITKTDANAPTKLLKGAEFTLFDKTGKEVQKESTDDNICKFTALPHGDYTIKETKEPVGYQISEEISKVIVSNANVASPISVARTNYKLGEIIITKTDADASTKLLKGAEFTLFDKTGKEVQKEATDDKGICKFTALPHGDYTIKETKEPVGYQISEEISKVTVSNANVASSISVARTNYRLGEIIITKTDFNDQTKALAGAEFTLFDKDNKELKRAVTGTDGICKFTNLPHNTDYTFMESKAPAGYQLDTTKSPSLKFDSNKTVIKYPVTNKVNRVEFVKVDKDSESTKLEGAKFELYLKDTNVLVGKAESNKEGLFAFEKLIPGTYYLKEVTAPSGYDLPKETYEFAISQTSPQLPIHMMPNVRTPAPSGDGGDNGTTSKIHPTDKNPKDPIPKKTDPLEKTLELTDKTQTTAPTTPTKNEEGLEAIEIVQTKDLPIEEIERLIDGGYVPVGDVPEGLTHRQLVEYIVRTSAAMARYPKAVSPITGDSFNTLLYPVALVGGIVSLALIFISKRKKQS